MNPRSYYMWTIGCQMNVADSQRVGALLESNGLQAADTIQQADVIILNSCVVRQGAEDKVAGELGTLKGLKRRKPDLFLGLMGCMVTESTRPELVKRFPQVDVFFNVLETDLLLEKLGGGLQMAEAPGAADSYDGEAPAAWYPGLPPEFLDAHAAGPTTYVPVIYGCNMNCSFCIVPSRRGRERSRPINEIVAEAHNLARHSIREITLLGQTVDAYGRDLVWSATKPSSQTVGASGRSLVWSATKPSSQTVDASGRDLVWSATNLSSQTLDAHGRDLVWSTTSPDVAGGRNATLGNVALHSRPDLADLLAVLSDVPDLWRLRFLTSHPLYMSDRIIAAVAGLPKVCPCINIPVQAGHDEILKAMRRGYTVDGYRRLVDRIRSAIPGVAVTTDLIVGFPGETTSISWHHIALSRSLQSTWCTLLPSRRDQARRGLGCPIRSLPKRRSGDCRPSQRCKKG